MAWFGLVLLVLTVLSILVDAWFYRRAHYRVLEALRERGPMTGLQLVREKVVSRAHVYLVLRRLEDNGKVEWDFAEDGDYEKQRKYKALR